MRCFTCVAGFAAVAFVTAGWASGQPAATPVNAASLLEQVEHAYAQTRAYQAVADFQVKQARGRWEVSRSAQVPVAFDRAGHRLLIDNPDFYVVVDDQLKLKSDQLPGRHLETDAPKPLTYDALISAVPLLTSPPLVDVAFLLSDDPVAALTGAPGATTAALGPDPADTAHRPRLRFQNSGMTYTLTIDPKTKLIRQAVIKVDASHMGGGSGDGATLTYDYDIQKHNEPLPAKTFVFDAEGSEAVGSLQELVNSGQNANAASGAAEGGPNALVGKQAPDFELAKAQGGKVKLSQVKEEVIVLDFWATWCPPCREALPKIQGVADWAKEGNKSVAVFAVDIGETKEQVLDYWKKEGFTMPILMDTQGKTAGDYGAQAIPQTVVISNGIVRHVHVGYSPDEGKTLKSEIEALLKK